MAPSVLFRMEMFREGDRYVSLCPELNVSSFGDTEAEAEAAIKEAVRLFVEQCDEMGTLAEVLEEAGFERVTEPADATLRSSSLRSTRRWVTREPLRLSTAEV